MIEIHALASDRHNNAVVLNGIPTLPFQISNDNLVIQTQMTEIFEWYVGFPGKYILF